MANDVINLNDYSLGGKTDIYAIFFDPENAGQIYDRVADEWVPNTVATRQTNDIACYATEADTANGGTGDFSVEVPSPLYDEGSSSYRMVVNVVLFDRAGATPAVDDEVVGRIGMFEF